MSDTKDKKAEEVKEEEKILTEDERHQKLWGNIFALNCGVIFWGTILMFALLMLVTWMQGIESDREHSEEIQIWKAKASNIKKHNKFWRDYDKIARGEKTDIPPRSQQIFFAFSIIADDHETANDKMAAFNEVLSSNANTEWNMFKSGIALYKKEGLGEFHQRPIPEEPKDTSTGFSDELISNSKNSTFLTVLIITCVVWFTGCFISFYWGNQTDSKRHLKRLRPSWTVFRSPTVFIAVTLSALPLAAIFTYQSIVEIAQYVTGSSDSMIRTWAREKKHPWHAEIKKARAAKEKLKLAYPNEATQEDLERAQKLIEDLVKSSGKDGQPEEKKVVESKMAKQAREAREAVEEIETTLQSHQELTQQKTDEELTAEIEETCTEPEECTVGS